MIEEYFTLKDWEIKVFLIKNKCNVEKVIEALWKLGCNSKQATEAYEDIKEITITLPPYFKVDPKFEALPEGYLQKIDSKGRIFYVDVVPSELNISIFKRKLRVNFSSVGKSNDSVDKDVWVSNVQENGFVNTATFSDTFDWSQGWTSNGLVISNGCEVMFDYAPFPQQKDSPTVEEANEYVGGDKAYTFEIEFMTQNVTDESAVLCDMSNELNTNKCGLLITGSEIKFTTPGGETVSSRFKEGDMNRATIVIHPETTSDDQFKGLVELYMNGVMSSIAKYNYTDKYEVFERNEAGNAVSKRLKFKGSEGADLVVKYFRTYNTVMSPDEVINNYIILIKSIISFVQNFS